MDSADMNSSRSPRGKLKMKYSEHTVTAHGTGRQTTSFKDGFHDELAPGWGAGHRVEK